MANRSVPAICTDSAGNIEFTPLKVPYANTTTVRLLHKTLALQYRTVPLAVCALMFAATKAMVKSSTLLKYLPLQFVTGKAAVIFTSLKFRVLVAFQSPIGSIANITL